MRACAYILYIVVHIRTVCLLCTTYIQHTTATRICSNTHHHVATPQSSLGSLQPQQTGMHARARAFVAPCNICTYVCSICGLYGAYGSHGRMRTRSALTVFIHVVARRRTIERPNERTSPSQQSSAQVKARILCARTRLSLCICARVRV